MKTVTENVVCIYQEGRLIAIVKRDADTGHKLVHLTKEADVDDIAEIINPDQTLV